MKLFACVFLVLVILEEYHCEPCLGGPCGGRRKDNDREKKLNVSLGFTAKTLIGGESEYKHENGHRRSYHPHHRYLPYGPNRLGARPRYQPDYRHHGYRSYRQNGLGNSPSYQPHYQVSKYPSYRTPYSTRSGRPFEATYNIPYGRQGGASNGTPQRTPYYRGSNGPQYDRPRYGTPTPFGPAHQTPNGSPHGAPNGSPNRTPNGTPAQTPVETDDGTPETKQFIVTPNGIQEIPAQPVDNASWKHLSSS